MMLYLRQPTGLICILGNKRMNDKKRNIRKNGSMHAYLFLLPSLTGVLVLFVIPYLDVIRRSFLDGTGQRFVGMDNYKTVVEKYIFSAGSGKYGSVSGSLCPAASVSVTFDCNLSTEE